MKKTYIKPLCRDIAAELDVDILSGAIAGQSNNPVKPGTGGNFSFSRRRHASMWGDAPAEDNKKSIW